MLTTCKRNNKKLIHRNKHQIYVNYFLLTKRVFNFFIRFLNIETCNVVTLELESIEGMLKKPNFSCVNIEKMPLNKNRFN